MSKFKLNSEWEDSSKNRKKHSSKKNRYDEDDFTDFAYMSRSSAKNELRARRDSYGI